MRTKRNCLAAFLLLCILPCLLAGAADYNKEFADNFFKLDQRDADINIKVYRKSPGTKVDPIGKQDGSSTKNAKAAGKPVEEDDGISISALGKILQLSLVIMLGLLIYTLSRKSRNKKRY